MLFSLILCKKMLKVILHVGYKNFRSVVEIFTSEDDVVVEKVRRKCFRNVGGVEVDSVIETILQGFRFRSRLA